MSGRYINTIEIKLEAKNVLDEVSKIKEQINKLDETEHEIKFNSDTKQIKKVFSKIEKTFQTLTNKDGFTTKQFETLSKELSDMYSKMQQLTNVTNGVKSDNINKVTDSIQKMKNAVSELNQETKQRKTSKYLSRYDVYMQKPSIRYGYDLKEDEVQIKRNIEALERLLGISHDIYMAKNSNDAEYENNANASLNTMFEKHETLFAELKHETLELENQIKSVNSLAKKLSSDSIVDEHLYTNLEKSASFFAEAETRLGELENKQSLNNSELEEYITLQLKLDKILKGIYRNNDLGADDFVEAKSTILKHFSDILGHSREDYQEIFKNIGNFYTKDNNHLSIIDDGAYIKKLKHLATEILQYQTSFSAFYGNSSEFFNFEGAKDNLERFKMLLDYVNDNIQQFPSLKSETNITENQDKIQEELKETEQVAKQTQEALNKANSNSSSIEEETKAIKEETVEVEKLSKAKEKLNESNTKTSSKSNDDFSNEIEKYKKMEKAAEESAKELTKARDVIRQAKSIQMDLDEYGNPTGLLQGKFSFSERLLDGTIGTKIAIWNNKTQEWNLSVVSVVTAFEEVGKEIIDLDNKINQYEIRRDKALSQHPTYNASADDELISLAEKRREILLDTLQLYAQEESYEYENVKFEERRLENQERLNALKNKSNNLIQSKNDEKALKSNEKLLNNITKTNRALNKQQILVKAIQSTYDKVAYPNLDKAVNNPDDLDKLATAKKQIDDILSELHDQGRNSNNEEKFQKLEKLIAEYKILADYKLKANNPSQQKLGGTNLEVAIKTQISQYDKLIIRAEKYGDETSDIVNNLNKQKALLTAIDENGVRKATSKEYNEARDEYKIAKSQIDIIETKAQNSYKEINRLIGEYSTIEKRLASGEGPKTDIARSEDLRNKILEIQGLEILSTSQIEDTEKKLNDLEAALDKIYINQKKKNTSKREIDTLEIEKFSNKLEISKEKMNELNLVSDEMKNKFNAVQEKFKELSDKLSNEEISLRKYKHEMNDLISTFDDYISVEKKAQNTNDKKRTKADAEFSREVYDELISKINRYKKVTSRIAKGDNVFETDKKEAEELAEVIEKLQNSKYLTEKQLNDSNSILNNHFDYTIGDIEKQKNKRDAEKEIANQKEIAEFNKKLNSELEKTENHLLSLEFPKNLRGSFNKLVDDIENLNNELKEEEISFEKYSTKVESKLRKFNSLVEKTNKESKKAFATALSNKEKGDHNYWQGRFSESIRDLSGEIKNPTLESMKKYYQELEKQADSAYKKSEEENKKLQSSVNSALKEQISALKKIESIRAKIAKADPENKEYISQLQESKKYYQKQYLQANKVLKVNQDLYDSEKHINELKQIGLETTAEITKYENKKQALLETQEKLNSLPQNSKFAAQFEEAKNKIEALNEELTTTNLSMKKYNNAVNEIIQNYSNLVKNDGIAENQKAYQKLIDIIEKYSDVSKRIAKGNAYESDETKAKVLLNIIKSLQKQPILSDEQLDKADKKLKSLATDLEDIKKKTTKNTLNDIDSSIKKIQKSLNNLRITPNDFHSFDEWKIKLVNIENEINKLKGLSDNVRIVDGIVNKDDLNTIGELKNNISDLITQANHIPQIERGWKELNATNVAEKIYKLYEDNSRMSRKAREEVLNWYNAIRSGNVTKPLNEILNIVEKIVQEERAAGRAGKSFFDIFKTKAFYGFIGQIQSYLSMYVGFYGMMNKARSAITTIIELDDALIDLKKTTTMTSSQLEDFYYESSDIAKQMGVTTQEIIEQASAWSRLGYSSQSASIEMAKLSSQFASISPGMDTETAQSGLVSIMKSWNIGYEDVKSEIMDNINILGNNFALSNEDIVDGMERSASAFAAVGTDYKEAFALFTATQEILQNAEKAGTALRSISLRIRGFDENSEDGLEETSDELENITGDLLDLTKTAEHTQGVSIFKNGSTTEFKSLVEYFGEIHEIWDEMSQKQQSDFLSQAFGKTQSQAGAALITNYDAVKDALAAMEDSYGSADKEMEIIQESITYKLNELKQTWVGTATEMVERGDIGVIVDELTKFSEIIGSVITPLTNLISKFVSLFGIVGSGAMAFGTIVSLKGVETFKQQRFEMENLLQSRGSISQLTDSFLTLNETQQQAVLSSNLLTEAQKNHCLAINKLFSANANYSALQLSSIGNISQETLANWGLTQSTDTLTISKLKELATTDKQAKETLEKIIAQEAEIITTKGVTKATKKYTITQQTSTSAIEAFTVSLKASALALKSWATSIQGIITIVVVIASLAVKAFNYLTTSVERQKEKMNEAVETYEDVKSELSSITTELETQQKEIDELLAKDKLTYVEEGQLEELQEVTKELLLQQSTLEAQEKEAAKNAALTALDTYDKEFDDFSVEKADKIYDNIQQYKEINGTYDLNSLELSNLEELVAYYFELQTRLEDAIKKGDLEAQETLKNRIDEAESEIKGNRLADMQSQLSATSYYYRNYIKDIAYENLSEEEKRIYDFYNNVSSIIDQLWLKIDPTEYKGVEFQNILNTNGIEKTKDELNEMAKKGELSPEIISQYENLSNAIDESCLSVEEFCDNVYAANDLKTPDELTEFFGENVIDELSEDDLSIALTFKTEDIQNAIEEARREVEQELRTLSKEGNVDLTIRPVIDSTTMQKKGWKDVEDGSFATTLTQSDFYWQGDEENGHYVYVHYTPILPDGNIMTPDSLDDYLYGTLEGSDDILDADEKGIVLKVDVVPDEISQDDIYNFLNNGESTQKIDDFIQKMSNWDIYVHDVQERYYDVGDGLIYCGVAMDNLIKKYSESNSSDETSILSESQIEKLEEQADELSSIISDIKSSFETLVSAAEEYNEQGYFSIDTINSLLELDTEYLDCLIDENGQISINATAMEKLAQAKLNEAEASAIAAAMVELQSVANGELTSSTETYVRGNDDLIESLRHVAGAYDDVKIAAFEASQAQSMSALIDAASEKDYGATQDVLERLNAKLNLIHTASNNLKTYGLTSLTDSDSSSSKDSTEDTLEKIQDKWKEYLDKCIELYQAQLEAGRIDYKTFLEKSKSLTEEFYRDGKISAEDYWDTIKNIYEIQLSIYDRVLSAVQKCFDNEIDKIQDGIDAIDEKNDKLNEQLDEYNSIISAIENAYDTETERIEEIIEEIEEKNEALSEEQETYEKVLSAIDKVYETQIDAYTEEQENIQSIIDELQESNDEREREIALMKAKYELERAQNQRTNYVYQDGQMVYKADDQAIKDAREELEDAEFDKTIADLEKQIDAIQETIDALEEMRDKWEEVANARDDALNYQAGVDMFGKDFTDIILNSDDDDIETFLKNYNKILDAIDDNTELIESYNEKVKYYEKLKKEWTNLTSTYEKNVNAQITTQKLGANWEKEILSARYKDFENFKDSYLAVQEEITNNEKLVEDLEEKQDYYSKLKEEWVEVSSVYEEGIDKQIAAMILGQDWEAAVLENRTGLLENFKNSYVSIQEQMADATIQSIDYAIDAISKEITELSDELKTATDSASSLLNVLKDVDDSKVGITVGGTGTNGRVDSIRKYDKGGIVGKSQDSEIRKLAKSVGEDTLVFAKEGERILTPEQNKYYEKLFEEKDKINYVPVDLSEIVGKIDAQSLISSHIGSNGIFTGLVNSSYDKEVPSNYNNEIKIEQTINMTLPNVTNNQGAEYLQKALGNITQRAYQTIKRR